jgi:SAM-dependent methyltransferase
VDAATLRYYEDHAGEVAPRYEAVAGGVSSFFPFVFSRGERILEIGAGSGRDAARLLGVGVEVDAVEPSAALRECALADHPELEGRLFHGFLPGGLPPDIRPTYDGILLSAVIMHIPDAELFDTAFQLRERLGRGGRLLLSMPIERSDVAPGDERDRLGRLMILRPVAQVKLLFERLGFSLDHEWTSGDGEGRDVLWATLVFRLSEARSRAIDRVESIINADRKVATYKLALIRALCDIATTSWASGRWERGGSVGVPLQEVSEKWLRYYWPLLDSDVVLPQINAESKDGKQIAFRGELTELVRHFRHTRGLAAFEQLVAEGSLPAEAAALDPRRRHPQVGRTDCQAVTGDRSTRRSDRQAAGERRATACRPCDPCILRGSAVRPGVCLDGQDASRGL